MGWGARIGVRRGGETKGVYCKKNNEGRVWRDGNAWFIAGNTRGRRYKRPVQKAKAHTCIAHAAIRVLLARLEADSGAAGALQKEREREGRNTHTNE